MTAVRRDAGYTLVELLVVMVILAILAGISIPVFLGQQEKAARAAMVSDLHTLRLAQESRSVDNNPRYTTNLSILRNEGYVQSGGVSVPHIQLSDGDNEYIACVKHERVDEWIVYSSVANTTSFAPAACAPAAS